MHFSWHGCEGLRKLHKDSFEIMKDTSGVEYVKPEYNEAEKCKKGVNKKEEEKETYMFAQPGDLNCPVYHCKRYKSLLHPNCPALFQHAKKKFVLTIEGDAKIPLCYDNVPVGYHTLADLMKKMAEGIRKTTVMALANEGFEAKDIMCVTGHRNVASLEPYLGRLTMKCKKNMSDALSNFGKTTTKPSATVTSPCDPASCIIKA